jgi:RHS repeat-associated protein
VTSATPEAGTIAYTYPVSGSYCAANLSLLCTRTDANSTKVTFAYDALSRVTGKTYSGSTIATNTHSVTYSYDQTGYNGLTITNGIGPITGMSDGSGVTAWSYDGVGDVKAMRKTINSVTKESDYTYNADGTPNTVTDYGGTVLTYSYDVSGRPTQISDGSGNTYAASAVYNAAGELTSLNHQLTSMGAAYARSWQYNSRLQPSVISATLNGNPIQGLTYGYGTSGTNNGNVMSITDGMASARSQTFSYDNLNRLQSAHDGSNWGETYTYDNWGNLYQTTRMSGYSGGNNWSLTAPGTSNQLSNQSYDGAGEVTVDQYSNSYSYDAEGRLLSAGSGSYVYDGAGNRVEKTVASTTTLYWPGSGSLLDESNSSGSTMAKQISLAGLLVWSENVTTGGRFLFQDHLGSTRVTGDASGNLDDDIDYLPFGSVEANYGASPSLNHYTFTGYESDQSDSSTDYAVFRNLNTAVGRFNRTDPYDGSYDATDPQSLNRYAYALDSPLNWIDPSGLLVFCDESYSTDDDDNDIYTYDCYVDSEDPGIEDVGPGGCGGGEGGSKNPKCSAAIMQPQYTSIFGQMGSQLQINPLFIMSTALQESGWNLAHVYGTNSSSHGQPLNNLFGMTNAGGNNIAYPSVQASAQAWMTDWGSYLAGQPQTIDEYAAALNSDPRHMYNSNPAYASQLAARYKQLVSATKACKTTF